MPLPIIGSNPDDGLLLGAFANWVRYGYKKFPYSQFHHLSVTAAASKVSLDVIYQGEFIRAAGKMDFTINSRFHGNRFAYNFFGLGNETPKINKDLSYNRVQNSLIYFNPNLRKSGSCYLKFGHVVTRSKPRIEKYGKESAELMSIALDTIAFGNSKEEVMSLIENDK